MRWRAYVRLSTALTAAVITLTALCLSGCASRRRSVSRESRWALDSVCLATDSVTLLEEDSVRRVRLDVDSVQETLETWTEGVTVPMSSVTLRIPADSLRALPPGAGYSDRSGQAHVSVRRSSAAPGVGELIYVDAGCDSLELVRERYERSTRSLRTAHEEAVEGLRSRLSAAERALENSQRRESSLRDSAEERTNELGSLWVWFTYGVLAGTGLTLLAMWLFRK